MKFHQFNNSKELTSNLVNKIKQNLCDAIKQRGQAYLVVSGGKTPVELFKSLAKTPLPWDKVIITLADERCVERTCEFSNEYLVKNHLLQDHAKSAQWVGLYDEQDNSSLRLKTLEQQLASFPFFDVVLLGLGEDGHTASLFACSEELEAALDEDAQAISIINPQSAPYQRLSLSKKRLLQSHAIFLHFTGETKKAVLEKALVESDPLRWPISAFLNKPQLQVMYAHE